MTQRRWNFALPRTMKHIFSTEIHEEDQFFPTAYQGFIPFTARLVDPAKAVVVASMEEHEKWHDVWLVDSPEAVDNLREFYQIEHGKNPRIDVFLKLGKESPMLVWTQRVIGYGIIALAAVGLVLALEKLREMWL